MLERTLRSSVPHYFYASSAHVCPIWIQTECSDPPIKEDQAIPAYPELSYGWAELIGEKIIEFARAQSPFFRTSVARITGAYGRNQDYDLQTGSPIPMFIRCAVEYPYLSPFLIISTGEQRQSCCFVKYIVEGIILSVEKLKQAEMVGPFNLGTEEAS